MRGIVVAALGMLVAMASAYAEEDMVENDLERVEKAMAKPLATGLLVTGVGPGSQAAEKGIAVGDIVTSYDGTPTPTLEALGEAKAKAEAAAKTRVSVTLVGAEGTPRTIELDAGSIGIGASAVEKGKAAGALPPATPFTFDFAGVKEQPHDDWYTFHFGEGPKIGFEHGMLEVKDGHLVMRREVAFDGGEQWGVNHFDVTIQMTLASPPRPHRIRFANPATGYWAEGKRQEDGRWHFEWTKEGEDEGTDTKTVSVPRGLPVVPTYLVETLAAFLPRRAGTCWHYRPMVDSSGDAMLPACLIVVAKETVTLATGDVEAWKIEQRQLGGQVGGTYWIDDSGRIVKSLYGMPIALLDTKEAALKGLHEAIKPTTAD